MACSSRPHPAVRDFFEYDFKERDPTPEYTSVLQIGICSGGEPDSLQGESVGASAHVLCQEASPRTAAPAAPHAITVVAGVIPVRSVAVQPTTARTPSGRSGPQARTFTYQLPTAFLLPHGQPQLTHNLDSPPSDTSTARAPGNSSNRTPQR